MSPANGGRAESATKSYGGVGYFSSSDRDESDDFSDDEPDTLFETETGVRSESSSVSLEQTHKGKEATRGGAAADAVGCQSSARAARGDRHHALRRSSAKFDAVMDTLAAQVKTCIGSGGARMGTGMGT